MEPKRDYMRIDGNHKDQNKTTDELLEYVKQQLLNCAKDFPSIDKLVRENFDENLLCAEMYSKLSEMYMNDMEVILMIQELYIRLDDKLTNDKNFTSRCQAMDQCTPQESSPQMSPVCDDFSQLGENEDEEMLNQQGPSNAIQQSSGQKADVSLDDEEPIGPKDISSNITLNSTDQDSVDRFLTYMFDGEQSQKHVPKETISSTVEKLQRSPQLNYDQAKTDEKFDYTGTITDYCRQIVIGCVLEAMNQVDERNVIEAQEIEGKMSKMIKLMTTLNKVIRQWRMVAMRNMAETMLLTMTTTNGNR